MNDLVLYFLKVNIAIALFYLLYRIAFSNDTFWKVRRVYLLSAILFSVVYPFILIQTWIEQPQPVSQLIQSFVLPEFTVNGGTENTFFTLSNIMLIVYGVVVLALIIKILIQFLSIIKLKKSGLSTFINDIKIVKLENELAPFSFFNSIYVNPSLHSSEELSQILVHEQTHVNQLHSVDVLLSEIVCIAFWFNPFVWLFKIEIRQNLEFLADNHVIESGFDSKSYQLHLLQLSYSGPDLHLTNKFNILPLKKRIIMMNQQKSAKPFALKYMLIVPLATSLLFTANATRTFESIRSLPVGNEFAMIHSSSDRELENTVNSTSKQKNAAQGPTINDEKLKKDASVPPPPPAPVDDNVIYQVVEKMPAFNGGDQALFKYLAENVKYPVICAEKNIQGRVICSFVVEKDGSVGDIKAIRSVDPLLDAEALRVIAAMPKWTPGEQKGEKVRVQYTLPINFKLDDGKSNQTKPLVVVNGEVMSANFDMNSINSTNIEKIDVLKNEAATKIYGDKGKNGVIIVTMKK